MRYVVYAALAVFSLGLIEARPAAAATQWECMGPPASCVSGKTKSKKSAYRAGSSNKAAYKASKKSYKVSASTKSKKSSGSVTSYSGGGYTGVASYYWQPQRVASGGWFNPNAMTAAHKTLPFGTKVRVTHLGNGRSVTVTINDRGPYVKGRIIDLSRAAASSIGMTGSGIARVSVAVLGRG